jgi:hypothetical protein
MDNENKYWEDEQEFSEENKLVPDKVEETQMPKLEDIEITIELPRGYVQVHKLDDNGDPIKGSEFNISEVTFRKVFEKRGYVIKKKAK